MKIAKISIATIILLMAIFTLNCCEDDCTKVVNILIYNPNHGNGAPFTDNYQEVPCDFEEPVTQPVN